MRRTAFTLIEMLITMVVIVVLMGLLFSAARLFGPGAKRAKSQSILAQVVTALASARASGSAVSLSEHPLAASAGTIVNDKVNVPYVRALFRRHRSGDPALATDGEALVGVSLAELPAAAIGDGQPAPGTRLLLPDDHLDDGMLCPHLYGMPRRSLTVIGDGLKKVTWYRRLPKPVRGVSVVSAGRTNDVESTPSGIPTGLTSGTMTHSTTIANAAGGTSSVLRREFLRFCRSAPYLDLNGNPGGENINIDLTGVGLVTPGHVVVIGAFGGLWTEMIDPVIAPDWMGKEHAAVGGTVADSKKAFEASLGPALTELAKLGAVYQPANDTPLIRSERLWTDGATASAWEPGFTKDGTTWKGYRLRGPAIYDAWNTEILVYRSTTKDGYIAVSAGVDGVFRWHPGVNGVLNTVVTAFGPGETTDIASPVVGPSGDDQWGGRDNIVVGEQ